MKTLKTLTLATTMTLAARTSADAETFAKSVFKKIDAGSDKVTITLNPGDLPVRQCGNAWENEVCSRSGSRSCQGKDHGARATVWAPCALASVDAFEADRRRGGLDDHRGPVDGTIVQVDRILIEHTDASRRDRASQFPG